MSALKPGRYMIEWTDEHGVAQRRKCLINESGQYRFCDDRWSLRDDTQWLNVEVAFDSGVKFDRVELGVQTSGGDSELGKSESAAAVVAPAAKRPASPSMATVLNRLFFLYGERLNIRSVYAMSTEFSVADFGKFVVTDGGICFEQIQGMGRVTAKSTALEAVLRDEDTQGCTAESIVWTSPLVELPDSEIDVMLCIEDESGERQTWPGVWTGEEWQLADGSISRYTVVAWGDMLAGPKRATAEALTNG
jgi:hypothetical protein